MCPQAYYYSAIVEDVLLRFSWTLNITLTTVVKGHGMGDILATVLAPMEVFRYLHPLTCLHLPFCCLFCTRPSHGTFDIVFGNCNDSSKFPHWSLH